MNTIMIIDDEPLIRRGLESMIPWDRLQCRLLGQASNGEDGLARIRSLGPDIVFTDIRMPKLDGLAMIQESLKEPSPPLFIVLSGYSDFDLVRAAMRLGAIDYLMKLELEELELIRVITEAKKRLSTSGTAGYSTPAPSDYKKSFIGRLLQGGTNDGTCRTELPDPQILREGSSFRLLCLKFPPSTDILKHSGDWSLNFVFTICREHIPRDIQIYEYQLDCETLILYLEYQDIVPDSVLEGKCELIIQDIRRYLNQKISIGISSGHCSIQHLPKAYREAVQDIELCSRQYMGEIYRNKVKKAVQYIRENRFQRITLNDVAQRLDITPSYLSKIFKKVTEQSFSDYVAGIKIEEAKKLLLQDNNRIYEVSAMVGYDDPYYFSKVFKRVTQMTPSEYIARN